MKKLFIALSIMMIAALVLVACGTTPAATATSAATAAPAQLSGTVRVGSWDNADALQPFNDSIASFQAAYPGVTVQLEDVPQDYGTKLLAEFASGTAPDVFQVGDGDVANFASKGVFEPLTDYISGANGNLPLDMTVFFPAIADIGKVGGVQYLLTKDYSPLMIYYNKTLFDAAGVSYPTSDWKWADLLSAAQKLTVTGADGKITQWGLQFPDSWGDWTWVRGILPIIYQNGGDIISADGTKTTGYLDSPATVAAFQWYSDLFTKYKIAPTQADVNALSGQDLFATGKVAMLWTGVWGLNDYIKNADVSKFLGTSGLPQGTARANSICWAGFGMYAKGTNKAAAWAFLRWIGADQGAQSFANYALTDVKSISDSQGKTTDPYWGPVMADLAFVHPLPDFTTAKFSDCVNTPIVNALSGYFANGGDWQTILSATATEADACLAKP